MGFYFRYSAKKKKKSRADTKQNLATDVYADFTPDELKERLEAIRSDRTNQRKAAAH
jgi:hypothetical protein